MKKLIIDALSGDRVEKDLDAEEIAELDAKGQEIAAEQQARIDAKASAIAKLEALGLTVDEVQVAFGLTAE